MVYVRFPHQGIYHTYIWSYAVHDSVIFFKDWGKP
jgi:hypothetical protein